MTPAEVNVTMMGYMAQRTAAMKEALTVAYLGAAWQRAKKMPKLDPILAKIDKAAPRGKRKKQSMKEMFAVAQALTKQLSK